MRDELTSAPPARPHRARRIVLVASILVAVLGLAGIGWGLASRTGPPSPPPDSAVSGHPAPTLASGSAAPRSPAPPDPTGAPLPASQPVSIAIPAIKVSAPIRPVGLNRDGTLEVPPLSIPNLTGWYRYGPTPGQVGPAVIVGHIDSTSGPAVFYRLSQLRPGARVTITTRNHSELTFVVDRLQRFTKAHFPASSVYAATPDPELRLVTCTGAFDASTGQYLDNLVVSAHLV